MEEETTRLDRNQQRDKPEFIKYANKKIGEMLDKLYYVEVTWGMILWFFLVFFVAPLTTLFTR